MSHLGLIWLLLVSKTTRVYGARRYICRKQAQKGGRLSFLSVKELSKQMFGKNALGGSQIFFFTSGRDKLWPRGHDVVSKSKKGHALQ